MDDFTPARRTLILAAGALGLGAATLRVRADDDADEEGGEVTANEDLMREHGIIRRALMVYGDIARRARKAPASVPLDGLRDTARLFREFAQDYHERGLEEAHIFPAVRKLNGRVATLPDVLLAQHQRGREITDYLLRVGGSRPLDDSGAQRLAATLDGFIAMYEPHAAREDTVLFPAWKAALGPKAYHERGEQFEDLEHKMFGHDGFDEARKRIARIEKTLHLTDLAAFTAPPPPAL